MRLPHHGHVLRPLDRAPHQPGCRLSNVRADGRIVAAIRRLGEFIGADIQAHDVDIQCPFLRHREKRVLPPPLFTTRRPGDRAIGATVFAYNPNCHRQSSSLAGANQRLYWPACSRDDATHPPQGIVSCHYGGGSIGRPPWSRHAILHTYSVYAILPKWYPQQY